MCELHLITFTRLNYFTRLSSRLSVCKPFVRCVRSDTDDGYLTVPLSSCHLVSHPTSWKFGKSPTADPFYIELEWPGYCIGSVVGSDVGCDVDCDVGREVGNVGRDVDVVDVAGRGAEEVFSLACIRPPSIPPISVPAVA